MKGSWKGEKKRSIDSNLSRGTIEDQRGRGKVNAQWRRANQIKRTTCKEVLGHEGFHFRKYPGKNPEGRLTKVQ